MSLLDMLGNKPKTAKANNNGVIEIGITEKDVTALLKGEIDSLTINRGLTTHVISRTGFQDANGLDTFKAVIKVSVPYDIVVAPAINGKKARVYVVGDVKKFGDSCLEGTAIVLTEENASNLYSNGSCRQAKDGVNWNITADASRQCVTFDGGMIAPFKYRCAALEKLGVDIDKLIDRI